MDRRTALNENVVVYFGDKTTQRTWSSMRRRFVELGEVLRRGTDGTDESGRAKYMALGAAAGELLLACDAFELAVEGYVFELRRSTFAAKRILLMFKLRRLLKPRMNLAVLGLRAILRRTKT